MTPSQVLAEFLELQKHNDPVTAIAGFLDWCVDESIEVPFLKVLPEDLRYEPGWVEFVVAMWGLAPQGMRYEIEYDLRNGWAEINIHSLKNNGFGGIRFRYHSSWEGYATAKHGIGVWIKSNPYASMHSISRDDIASDKLSLVTYNRDPKRTVTLRVIRE